MNGNQFSDYITYFLGTSYNMPIYMFYVRITSYVKYIISLNLCVKIISAQLYDFKNNFYYYLGKPISYFSLLSY